MGLPRYHSQPALCLMYRTLENLTYIDQHKCHGGPFEVTQLINSFLAVVAHPWDQLLDKQRLTRLKLRTSDFRNYGFPIIRPLPVDGAPEPFNHAHDLLRLLRNGMAHGNFELLDRKQLRTLRPTGPLPHSKEKEITSIHIWNQKCEDAPIVWHTALDIIELRTILKGMMRLCEDRNLWKDQVRVDQEQLEAKRKFRRAS